MYKVHKVHRYTKAGHNSYYYSTISQHRKKELAEKALQKCVENDPTGEYQIHRYISRSTERKELNEGLQMLNNILNGIF